MNLKIYLKKFLVLAVFSIFALQTWAQQTIIKGTVFESDGKTPVIGCVITAKGTTRGGVASDLEGSYSIKASEGETLEFACVGYKKQSVTVGKQAVIDVKLELSVHELGEMVVTALGITRDQKSLGYAVTKVGNEDMTKALSNNWLNGMSGKVAGLNFSGASSGPIGSVRVTLRGDRSLNYGKNEALFVVDGVPIKSDMTASTSNSSYTGGDNPVDFGNGASDLNPDDIESVSVLKGPAATALYGSRAANGAIVITTKSGSSTKGIGISYNSSVVFEDAGYWPNFQKEYGSGSDLGLNEYCFWTLDQSLTGQEENPDRNLSRYAWGEKFGADKLRYQYAGKNWETGTISKTPFVYQDDWYTGIFKTGVTYNNGVTLSGSDGKGRNVRLSLTDSRNEWILPNTGFTKQSVSLSFETPVNKRIKFNTKVNYYRTNSDNMPMSGYSETTVMYDLMWGYNSNSMNDWKSEYFNGRYNAVNRNSASSANGNSLVFAGSGSYNPYRVLYEETNSMDKDRVFGSVGLNIDLAKHLTLDLKSGMDMGVEFRTQKKPMLTTGYEFGYYREQILLNYEFNSDFLLKYQNDFVDKRLSVTAAFGGNNMTRSYFRSDVALEELLIDGKYLTTNVPSGVYPNPYTYRSQRAINSLYGFASFGWDDTYYLDITGRNDWSSTLSAANRSYFYPSISGSILLDRLFDFKNNAPAISFAKVRLSWANVGNDTDPYSLIPFYTASSISGGYTLPTTVPNENIKPENVESWELGLEAKFLDSRLGFDACIYNTSATDQIVSLDEDLITGASAIKINAGEINNKGIELSVSATPVKTKDFTWNINANWSKNKNVLVSLYKGYDNTIPFETDMGTTIGGRLHAYSFVGKEMNQLYGIALNRAAEGSYYLDDNGKKVDCSGQVILDATTGLPTLTGADTYLGKIDPDWKGGFNTSLRYKNLTLSMNFSYQVGGHRYSVTDGILSYQGKLKNTVEGRYDGIVADGINVISTNEDGSVLCQQNNTITSSIYTYYQAYAQNRYNAEAHTYDTSFLKFKEARLDYDLPKSICKKLGFLQSANFGIYATNIFCLDNWPQYDPEAGMMTGANVFNGIEAGAFPMTRTTGINVKLSF